MSTNTSDGIYTGLWINWSRGRILGSTLTLSQRNGGLLTAFLGIFVTVAGTACWRILSFCIHQYRATYGAKDAIHYQQQVIFRNSSTPEAAAWRMVQLSWYWRRLTNASLRHLLFIALALCNTILFIVAGVFSSEVTKGAGDEILINSQGCGVLQPMDDDPTTLIEGSKLQVNWALAAKTYSRACYIDNPGALQCSQFVEPRLSWSIKKNVSCPFQSDLCLEGPTTAFQMDTGRLDTHKMLGINAKESDRLQYRKVTTCSVLNHEGHVTEGNQSTTNGNTTLLRYYYGGFSEIRNWTFQYNIDNIKSQFSYILVPRLSVAGAPDQKWTPIKALNRTDADITIMFVASNAVVYNEPVYDPLFRATQKTESPTEILPHYYLPDLYVGVLACADQFQYCNPSNKACTPLAGKYTAGDKTQWERLEINSIQRSTFDTLSYALQTQNIFFTVSGQGGAALRASDTVAVADMRQDENLPANQWTIELETWFAASLARLQQSILSYATGPSELYERMYVQRGNQELCGRQKICSSSGYISFSVLGVSVILILGSFLIVLSLFIDTLVGSGMVKLGWKEHKRIHWAFDGDLQLLRLAFEGVNQGGWTGDMDAVPVTRNGHELLHSLASRRNGSGAKQLLLS